LRKAEVDAKKKSAKGDRFDVVHMFDFIQEKLIPAKLNYLRQSTSLGIEDLFLGNP